VNKCVYMRPMVFMQERRRRADSHGTAAGQLGPEERDESANVPEARAPSHMI